MSSKYAALPDLDQSQDIYETPDLVSDVSTVQTTLTDIDDDEDASSTTSQIDHTRLRPSDAAQRFRNAEVDASNVDFSDRITGKRQSYVVGTRREEPVEETPERRLARLRREVEELRGQVQAQQGEVGTAELERGVDELAEVLQGLSTTKEGAQGRLAKKVLASVGVVAQAKREVPPAMDGEDTESGTTATYTVMYAPEYKKMHTLGMVADFDQRLTILEKVLGMSASALGDFDQQLPANAIIPHLDELSRQMEVLSGSTTSSLDAASRRVKQLASDTEKLADARKAAKAAAVEGGDPFENDETVAKINALYGVLPTIEGMKPVLPAMLDRLRCLRAIHQDAARASEALAGIESRQAEVALEIQKWEEALEKVEGVMQETTGTIEQNMLKVEGWVREIERKMEVLD